MIAGFVFAACFYGFAEYERMSGWMWAIASLAVTFTVLQLTGMMLFNIPAQVILFGVMAWRNSKRLDKLPEERAARRAEDQRIRQERVRRAHEEADRKA